MKHLKVLVCALLCLALGSVLLASCEPASVSDGGSDAESDIESVDASLPPEDSEMAQLLAADKATEKTDKPALVEKLTVVEGRSIVCGTCEAGSKVYVECEGAVLATLDATDGIFIYNITFTRDESPRNLNFYAKNGEEGFSEPIAVRCSFRATKECPYQDFVRVGKDGWVFFTNTDAQYTNNEHLPQELVDRISESTKAKCDWLAANGGAELIYVLVPNTNEIYSEYMYDDLTKGNVSLREEVGDALAKGGAYVIDLYDVLAQHKSDDLAIYHKTDSHWTEYGAYFGYKALFTHIAEKFPASAPRDIGEFNFANEQRTAGDLYFDIGFDHTALTVTSTFSDVKFDTPVDILKYISSTESRINEETMGALRFDNTDDSGKPDVFIMRDSYSVMMFDWIAERCDVSSFKALWEFGFKTEEISECSPDYVIYIISDMNILSIIR